MSVVAPDVIFERRVSTGNDDAEENPSGSVNLSSSDLELVQESSTQTIGIRFQNVNVPPEATIVKAWLQFQADESHLRHDVPDVRSPGERQPRDLFLLEQQHLLAPATDGERLVVTTGLEHRKPGTGSADPEPRPGDPAGRGPAATPW